MGSSPDEKGGRVMALQRSLLDARRASRAIQTLDEFLRPVPVGDFFQRYFGQAPVYVTGMPGRFECLQTWETLNSVLSYPLEGIDLQLQKNGAVIPRAMYSKPASDLFGAFSQLDPRMLQGHFKEGAMLAIRNFEIWDAQVSAICRLLERSLRCYMHAVVFAGWHDTQGFRTHWDAHDAFILQLAGRKHWRVYQPDCKHPFTPTDAPEFMPRSASWEGDLGPGDLLYIPRGWWHDAVPVGEVSLHVTVGGRPPTGVDLARRIASQLADDERFRATLPSYKSAVQREEYMSSFRVALSRIMDSVTIDSFLRSNDAERFSRGRLSLPWATVPDLQALPLPQSSFVHWLPTQPCDLEISGDALALEVMGRKFTFSRVAAPVLHGLISERVVELATLRERNTNTDIDNFIVQLSSAHLVAITSSSSV